MYKKCIKIETCKNLVIWEEGGREGGRERGGGGGVRGSEYILFLKDENTLEKPCKC